MTDEIAAFRRARERVLGEIADACARAGRSPGDVTLVAVSKTVAAPRVRDAVAAGFDVLGENRVQELIAKAPDVEGAVWHLIGPLQSNKARRAVEVASVIQSVDSVDLAARLDRLVREVRGADAVLPVYLQVNVDRDPSKFGFREDEVAAAAGSIADLASLDVRGLMTVGRLVTGPEEARATFAGLRRLSEGVRSAVPSVGPGLSMGMSEDFAVAVEEGATVVRVGRAIFGERPPA